jgi:Mg2+/Co2+ transporter CorC
VNGWIVDEMDHIPFIGETLQYENLFIKVTSADTKKVLEILIKVQDIQHELEEDIA